MARRKKNRKPPKTRRASNVSPSDKPSSDESSFGSRIRPWLLSVATSLFVVRVLFPSESAAIEGDGQIVAMLWVLLGVAWAAGTLVKPTEFRLRFGWTDAAVGLLIGWHTLAALVAVRNGSPRPALNMLWEWVAMGMAFFLVRQLFTGRREARAAVAVMIALAVALSTYGLYQYFYELPATRAMYAEDPAGVLREAGMGFGEDSTAKELFENRLASVEPFATFALTNSLAAYLAPWLVMALGIGIIGFRPRKGPNDVSRASGGPWTTRLGVASLAIPVSGCLILTKSRAGYLATCAGLGLLAVLWWYGRQTSGRIGWKAMVAIITIVMIVAVGVWGASAIGGLDVEVLSEASKSLGYRVQYWQSTAAMIADHPWLGCGPGQFQNAYTLYKLPQASEEIADPHNFLLEVWATAGTPAVLALLAVLATFAWSLCRVGDKNPTEEDSTEDAPGFILGGGIAGFFVAVPIALASLATPGHVAVMVGLCPAILTLVILTPWIWRGQMPGSVPAIGLVVLLLGLLFSGGIGFPGVAGTLWLLLGLGLNTAWHNPVWTLPVRTAVAVFAVLFILACGCYMTSYRPVIGYRGAMDAASADPTRAQFHLEKARSADRLSAQPPIDLATLFYTRWQADQTTVEFEQLEEFRETALRLSPRSASTWHYFAQLFHQIGIATGQSEQSDLALDGYRRAVSLYPTNCRYRADLAEILNYTGDLGEARREAAEALRLDELTPHADKKLRQEQRQQLSNKILWSK